MDVNDYQKAALRTMSDKSDIVDAALGLAGESGEFADLVKKHIFQGHELDSEHLAKELGDIAWYLAVGAYVIGYDLETIFQTNIEKLRSRYPNGFDSDKSLHRKEGDI